MVTSRKEVLEDAIGLLLHSLDLGVGGIDDGTHLHALIHATDGDGWNEPYSLRTTCACGTWSGVEWMQADRDQSDRPSDTALLLAWRDHIADVLCLNEDDDPSTERTLL